MIFETLFLIGLIGFLAMASMGALHGHGHEHSSNAHDSSANHHGGHHTPNAHHGDNHGGHHADGTMKVLQGIPFLFSPMNLFAWSLAAGAAGVLLKRQFEGAALWALVVTAGLLFTFALVRPMMRLILNFASKPSEGLEGQVSKQAEAISAFDAQGRGLIKIVLDGEVKQLLATLDPLEKKNGLAVNKGDRVYISSIDPDKGTCVVIGEP